jgi:hypothetical protein
MGKRLHPPVSNLEGRKKKSETKRGRLRNRSLPKMKMS